LHIIKNPFQKKIAMITVKMTEAEYKAYLLYLKSIEVMQEAGEKASGSTSMKDYAESRELYKELEMAVEEVMEGKITYVDPGHLWKSIG
jgi:hypothetical protein